LVEPRLRFHWVVGAGAAFSTSLERIIFYQESDQAPELELAGLGNRLNGGTRIRQ